MEGNREAPTFCGVVETHIVRKIGSSKCVGLCAFFAIGHRLFAAMRIVVAFTLPPM